MLTRTENVANQLRDKILHGHYPAGSRLQEVPVCEEMGVSRTPVRAALASLAAEGLLDYFPNRGYSVRGFSLQEIESTYEIRANLEGIACRLAAENGLSKKISESIETGLIRGDEILSHGRLRDQDREPWMEMNNNIHSAFLEAAQNRLLCDLVERTYHVPLSSSRVIHWYDYRAVCGSHELHHRIFDYVRNGKGVNAEALMREHVLQAIDQIKHRMIEKKSDGTVVLLRDHRGGEQATRTA